MSQVAGTLARKTRTSKVLWIPLAWLFIACSRPVSFWFNAAPRGDSTDRYLEGSPFDRNVFTALIVTALVVLVMRRQRVGSLLRANWPIILFLLYCGLSIFWSDFPDVAFKRWIKAVGDIAMVLVVLSDPRLSAAVKTFLARAGFLIIPLSILFDIGRAFSGLGYRYGLATNKNTFGMVSMIMGLGAVWRFLAILPERRCEHRTRQLMAHGSIALMAMWCLWIANSATSAACFLLGSMLTVITSRWSFVRKPIVLHLVVVSLVFVALYATILNPNIGIVSTMGKDPTLTGRTDVWQAVIPMTPSRWFGAGFESFWLGARLVKIWSIFPWHPNEAHNGYIEIYLNLGWTGIILLAVVMVAGYRKVISGLREGTNASSLWLAYFVAAVVYNLTEAGLRIFNPVWIFFLAAIIVVPKACPPHAARRRQTGSTQLWPQSATRAQAAARADSIAVRVKAPGTTPDSNARHQAQFSSEQTG